MPTHDPTRALDERALHHALAAATSGTSRSTGLGVEVELFPFRSGPLARVPLQGPQGTLARLAAPDAVQGPLAGAGRISEDGWHLPGASISFEPGGQVEVSTHYHPTVVGALDAADRVASDLAGRLAATGATLAAAGTDVWTPGTTAQQRTAARYPAMDRYLAARGPSGRTMMRDTCALQLNLDLGIGPEARLRWLVTNLLAPLATATFAASPSPDGALRSRRSHTWQQVDPTRTGFPRGAASRQVGVSDQLRRFALDADVMLLDAGRGRLRPGRPGWRFLDWVADGHPEVGWPTAADLDRHLTTLFPEVRPRGFLEIRSIDALPARWRRVPAVLYAGATYDTRARDRILDLLTHRPAPLGQQLRAAAATGLSRSAWCALAVETWSLALAGAARLGRATVAAHDLRRTERFLDRFTLRGLTPADELAGVLRRGGPAAALRWAAEPVPSAPSRPPTPDRPTVPATRGGPRP